MCDCLQRFDEKLKPQNLRVLVALFHDRTANQVVDRPYFQAVPIEKKRGAKTATILPKFCPFCGIRYEGAAPEQTNEEAA